MQTIFHNRYQAKKLRLLIWASFLACGGLFYWSWDLAHTFGLAPGEGGVLAPVHERLAWGGAVAALGLALGLAMMGYASRYVVRIEREAGYARFWTLTPWGIGTWLHVLPVAALGRAKYHHGRLNTGRHSVNAPWLTVPVESRWLPFILDLQAEHVFKPSIDRFGVDRGDKPNRRARRRKLSQPARPSHPDDPRPR